jgi:hypothetical protein
MKWDMESVLDFRYRISFKHCMLHCKTSTGLQGFPPSVTLFPIKLSIRKVFAFHKHNVKRSAYEMLIKYKYISYPISSLVHTTQNYDISVIFLKTCHILERVRCKLHRFYKANNLHKYAEYIIKQLRFP